MRALDLRGVFLALALLLSTAHVATTQASRDTSSAARLARGEPLRLGDAFPHVAGSALSGRQIALPDTTSSRSTVVVFSFSRAGGNDAGQWNQRITDDSSMHDRVDVVLVAELEGAPRLMRGLIRSGMKKGMPPNVRDQMLVLDRDEAIWKRRLGVSAMSHSYVVLIAPNGRIGWMSDGAYDEDQFARLQHALR